MNNFDSEIIELVEKEMEKVAAGKMDVKAGATKVLAIALSALSATSGIETNAMRIPENSNKVTTKKSNLKKGVLALAPLAVLSLLGIARKTGASETKMPEPKEISHEANTNSIAKDLKEDKHEKAMLDMVISEYSNEFLDRIEKIDDLFHPEILVLKPLEGGRIPVHSEEYWNEDITNELVAAVTDSSDLLKPIREIFGNNFFVDLEIAQDINFLAKEIPYYNAFTYNAFTYNADLPFGKVNNLIQTFGKSLLFKDGRITITRKSLLKFIIFKVIKSQQGANNVISSFSPLLFKEIMDLVELSSSESSLSSSPSLKRNYIYNNLHKCVEEAQLKECDKLLSLLSYYFAVNNLIFKKLINITERAEANWNGYLKGYNFINNNTELFNKWMNAQTFQEYKDYSENILAEFKFFKETEGYKKPKN